MSVIKLAKTSGFCYGVNRAIETVYELLRQGKRVCTLGPIIHNSQMVDELAAKGVRIVESPEQVKDGETLVIRSHGVEQSVIDRAEELSVEFVDLTCPFVSKIHKIVSKAGEEGRTVLVAGDKFHKEVVGIVGHKKGKCIVFADRNELEKLQQEGLISHDEPLTVVAQTTFNKDLWDECQKTLKKVYTNQIIFDTICNATAKRQNEAKELAAQCDAMIVVGGRHSSNTKKLKQVCEEKCQNVVLIETSDELDVKSFEKCSSVGVVAGASTPSGIIKGVLRTMDQIGSIIEEKDEINFDEMSFEEALEAFGDADTERMVKGQVVSVNQSEIQVEIGRKHAGFVPASEYSNDPAVKLTEEVKVGDVLDLIIMRTNDQEGTVLLSKRRVDAIAGWEAVKQAKESQEVLEGVVSAVVKGGVTTFYKGVRVFIPASHAGVSKNDSLEELKGTNVRYRIIEIARGRRVIGSVRSVLREERKAQLEKFWENIAEGDRITGTVKSLTGYGAFVDLGGVDGMIHISELSWAKIKHPSEVVNVGDSVEVYVNGLDKEKKRISLGYKKADENPWLIFENKFAVGDVVKVTVVSLTAYGAFARIIPGVDGLIHISQIADRHIDKPKDELSIGQEVDAKIIEINTEKKRVSLSIRALIAESAVEYDDESNEEAEQQPSEEIAELESQVQAEAVEE